eukprot:c26639_g1_i1 orf=1-222(-)
MILSMARLQSTASSPEGLPSPKRSPRPRASKLISGTDKPGKRNPSQATSSQSIADIEDSGPRFSEKEAALIKAN